VETDEVEIPAIDHVERPWLQENLVEDVHIVHLPVGDDHDRGHTDPELEQGVKFDGPLRFLNTATGKSDRQRSMVVESRAYTTRLSSMPNESWMYSFWLFQ